MFEPVAVCFGSVLIVVLSALSYVVSKLIFVVWTERTECLPELFHQSSIFNQSIIRSCPALRERYCPPLLWGKWGQAQTFLYGVVGRFGLPRRAPSCRVFLRLPDATTASYDLYQPREGLPLSGKVTVLVCPGIGNSAESTFLQSLVAEAGDEGHRVAVLSHTGSLEGVPLTSGKLFSYGGTGELTAMFEDVKRKYPESQIAVVGFSLGANIVVRFIGESPQRQQEILCAVSVCQGYDPVRALDFFKDWDKGRILYNWHITRKMKQIVYRHGNTLLDPCRNASHLEGEEFCCYGDRDCNGLSRSTTDPIDVEGLRNARLIYDFDEAFSRRLLGFPSVKALYAWSGCAQVLPKIGDFPLLLLNSRDDPLVDPSLFDVPRSHALKDNSKAMFVSTNYGGHLGFFESGFAIPNPVTWMDRLVMQYIKSTYQYKLGSHKTDTVS